MKTWQTRQGETVSIGDTVAVNVPGHRGAKGVIVVELDADSAEVLLTGCETCSGGVSVRVYEDGFVWLLAVGAKETVVPQGGGESPVRDYDDYCRNIAT